MFPKRRSMNAIRQSNSSTCEIFQDSMSNMYSHSSTRFSTQSLLLNMYSHSSTRFSTQSLLFSTQSLLLIAGLPGLTATTFCITGGFFVAATATGCAMVCILFRLATLLSLGYTFITSVLISHGDVGHSADTWLLTFHIGIPLSPRWSYHWTAAHPHLGNSKSEILHTERS